jgi:hypothetical protein
VPSGITIKPVVTKQDRRAFIRMPEQVFGPGDHWIKPLEMERLEHLDPKKNPYFKHAEVALFLAYRDGRPVGRISAQLCRLQLERHDPKCGQFGFLDAIDDKAVFKALLETAEAWLAERGMERAFGPFSFSVNDEVGLLVEGFDTPPYFLMGHAKPYYASHLEALGYTKAKDLKAYAYSADMAVPDRVRAIYQRVLAAKSVTVRPLRMKDLATELAVILEIFNDAWSDNWGFVPMTEDEILELGKNLKMLVKPQYIAIASYSGEPAAVAVTLPNINHAIRDLNGRLLPFGWAKLLWRLKLRPPGSARLALMGVRKSFQNTSLGAALAFGVVNAVRRYHEQQGTHKGEISWILEDNSRMRRMIEAYGLEAYKTYRIYRRDLDRAP